jgi:phosphate transport system substrate-binding protein
MIKQLFKWLVYFTCTTLCISCTKSTHKDYSIIQNKGSDTLVNLAQVWAEAYRQEEPKVAVSVSGGGSGTGIAALINNQVDIANSSRPMKEEEITKAKLNSGGKDVHGIVVALDALSVFVHPSNPLTGLSIEELACIFGAGGKCEKWSDIRGTVVPGCKDNQIIRVSRQSNSGTYQYFQENIVGKKRNMKLGSLDLNGSKESIDLVKQVPCAIGYTGMGYINQFIKALCISNTATEECVFPNMHNAITKKYPITRELYFYYLGEPSPIVAKYMDWIKSVDATKLVMKMGYVPSPSFWTPEQLKNLLGVE